MEENDQPPLLTDDIFAMIWFEVGEEVQGERNTEPVLQLLLLQSSGNKNGFLLMMVLRRNG